MSNAVTSLTAAIVTSEFISNINPKNTSDTSSIIKTNSKDNSIDVSTNKSLINNNSTSSPTSSTSSTSSASSSSSISTENKADSSSTIQMANNTNLISQTPQQQQQQQQSQQHQVHPIQLSGIQYFQYPSTNSTTPVNVSPLSSLTSSPSTTNTPTTASSIHYNHHHHHHHQQHPHYFHPAHHHHHQTIAFNPTLIQQQQPIQTQIQPFHAFNPNFKDTRWLTLEVCREYQRNKCNRTDTECKFAHPPQHVEIVNGKVIACYDSLKGKCTRKEPPCKYLHPPQHLKDQLLQNGKNNLVLRQVALAMMQQQQQQHNQPQANSVTMTNPAAAAAALLAVNANNVIPSQTNTITAQYATFTNPTGATHTVNAGAPNSTQIISASALANAGIAYQQVQLNPNGQPTLLPILQNNFHPAANQAAQNLHLSQQAAYIAADPTGLLHQVNATSALSPGAAAATANGLLAPQQRTDRLLSSNELTDAQNAATYTLDNGQTYHVPHFQIYPIYQRAAPNSNLANKTNGSNEDLNQQNNFNKAASASATANAAVNATVVDVVPGKKRPHDAIEQDFIPLNSTLITGANNSISSSAPVKRAALADDKTGLPVYHHYNPAPAAQYHHLHPQAQHLTLAQHPVSAVAAGTLGYPTAINIPMQYAPFISLPYTGHPSGVPRL